jgi:hypothetical protein
LRTLSYGQKLQISEGSIKIPLDDARIDTWVTKSEELNDKKGNRIPPIKRRDLAKIESPKGEKEMTTTPGTPNPTDGGCTPQPRPGYFNWTPKPIPQAHCALAFSSCCCEDGTAGLIEALFVFALAKKAANPNILSVVKQYSPNGSCSALGIDLNLFSGASATIADYDSIVQYYLTLLGY